jgi:hypothetical protein
MQMTLVESLCTDMDRRGAGVMLQALLRAGLRPELLPPYTAWAAMQQPTTDLLRLLASTPGGMHVLMQRNRDGSHTMVNALLSLRSENEGTRRPAATPDAAEMSVVKLRRVGVPLRSSACADGNDVLLGACNPFAEAATVRPRHKGRGRPPAAGCGGGARAGMLGRWVAVPNRTPSPPPPRPCYADRRPGASAGVTHRRAGQRR